MHTDGGGGGGGGGGGRRRRRAARACTGRRFRVAYAIHALTRTAAWCAVGGRAAHEVAIVVDHADQARVAVGRLILAAGSCTPHIPVQTAKRHTSCEAQIVA